MPRATSLAAPSEPSTSSQPVAGPSSSRQSQRAMTFHHYQPPSSAVDNDNDETPLRVAAAVANGGPNMPLRWAKPQSVDENRALTQPLPRIPHHPTLPPPPFRSSSAPSAQPVVSSRNTPTLPSSSHHVRDLPLNGSPRAPVQPNQYGAPQRPLGPSRPSLDPNTSSQHESLSRTTIFTNIHDLAAHHGIPQHLPPLPIKSAARQPQDTNPAQPQPELPSDFDFATLCQNYLTMLSQNNTEMSAINTSDLAAAAMGVPIENDAVQLLMAVLSGTPNIPVAPEAAPQFTSPAFLSSPLDTPLDEFLDTPAIPDMEFSPDIQTSPLFEYLNFSGSHDLPLFENMPGWDQPAAPAKPAPLNTNTSALDGLIPLSPETPALDPSSLTPSPAFTDLSSFPSDPASRPRKSLPTGTRKNVTPETLIPLDAPIQPRKYLTPSSTSRKDLPATFVRKRARTGETDDLPPDEHEEDAIASKRLQNTLAARRSRKRKLEYQRQLEDEIASERAARAALQARVMQLELSLAQAGLPLPP